MPHTQTMAKNKTITAVPINLDTATNLPAGKAGVLKSSGYFNLNPPLLRVVDVYAWYTIIQAQGLNFNSLLSKPTPTGSRS